MIPAGTRAQAECWIMRLCLAQKPPMRLIRLAPAIQIGRRGPFYDYRMICAARNPTAPETASQMSLSTMPSQRLAGAV